MRQRAPLVQLVFGFEFTFVGVTYKIGGTKLCAQEREQDIENSSHVHLVINIHIAYSIYALWLLLY